MANVQVVIQTGDTVKVKVTESKDGLDMLLDEIDSEGSTYEN